MDDETRRRTYAEWFVWAARNLTSTAEIRHACAEAATEAKAIGQDPAAAARAAAASRAGPGWVTQASPGVRAYAEWYDWARTNLSLTGDPLHHSAAAALAAMEAGGDAAAAASAARASAGVEPPAPTAPTQPAPTAAAPPTASAWPAPAAVPPPPGWQPAPASGPHPPAAAATSVSVPVWVTVVLAFGSVLSLLLGLIYTIAVATPSLTQGMTSDVLTVAWVLVFLGYLMFVVSLLALIGIIVRAGWARVMSIVAGALFCLSCIGILLGVPVIVGAATARPGPATGQAA